MKNIRSIKCYGIDGEFEFHLSYYKGTWWFSWKRDTEMVHSIIAVEAVKRLINENKKGMEFIRISPPEYTDEEIDLLKERYEQYKKIQYKLVEEWRQKNVPNVDIDVLVPYMYGPIIRLGE